MPVVLQVILESNFIFNAGQTASTPGAAKFGKDQPGLKESERTWSSNTCVSLFPDG